MALPNFTAEQSLYGSSRYYRRPALASAVGGVRPSYGQPGGSYLQSCPSCTYTPSFFGFDSLECLCYDESGNLQQTTLFGTTFCQGDIYNTNGILVCDLSIP